jgi:hypothetical protein
MGNEIKCRARFGKQVSEGRALLETSEIVFRGQFRLKIVFPEIQTLEAVDGELRVRTAEGLAVFEIGEAAEKWREKILHPKTRLEKLGVKVGIKVTLIGKFDGEFLRELKALQKASRGEAAGADLKFLAASSRGELEQVHKIAKGMRGAAGLWIVYPKGQKDITENDVIGAGRKRGLRDVKVCGFSATHTALKFVIPVEKR